MQYTTQYTIIFLPIICWFLQQAIALVHKIIFKISIQHEIRNPLSDVSNMSQNSEYKNVPSCYGRTSACQQRIFLKYIVPRIP